jgi:ADP-ribose pyrophosphatase YjhB (NUDIX family)
MSEQDRAREPVDRPASSQDLLRWAETLAGIARTGLAFTPNLYERERFDEVLRVAADIRAAASDGPDRDETYEAWLASVRAHHEGYVTPKVAVGAVVGNEEGELLLTQRTDHRDWLYPVGWADVGYSPSEVAVKEALEETGMEVEPVALIAVLDGLRLGLSRTPLYSMVFHCRLVGGTLAAHPLEAHQVGFYPRDSLPQPVRGGAVWLDLAFAAIDGRAGPCRFDPPRVPPWRTGAGSS